MTDNPETTRQANLEPARRYADAWLAGDFPAMLATYSDDFVVHWSGNNPMAGTRRGKTAAIEALLDFTRRTGRRLVAVDEVKAGETRAVILARESITAGDETRELDRVLVYRIENGLLAECWVYDEDQAFIDRALSA